MTLFVFSIENSHCVSLGGCKADLHKCSHYVGSRNIELVERLQVRLIFAFCYTYTGNYKYRNIYINLEHLLFTNNANNDVNRYKIYLF